MSRFRFALWLLAVPILPMLLASPAVAQGKFNLGEARKSVVSVRRLSPAFGVTEGSGFLVSDDGLIVTNRHVAAPLNDEAKGTVLIVGVPTAKDADVLEYYRAETVLVSPARESLDLAFLRIAGKPGAKFRPLPLAFDKLDLGADVAVLGYPPVTDGEPNLSVTKGSISATKVKLDDRAYYQTDAAINPGNSGGPMVNDRGEAVGVVTLRKRNAENVGFAMHLAEIKSALEDARERADRVKPTPGPTPLKDFPLPACILPKKENWDVMVGEVREVRGAIIIDNNGGTYWVASKERLPEDFQLVIRCQVVFLKGRQVLQPSQKSILRTVCIRFATDDVKTDILERKGNHIKFSHEFLLFSKEDKTPKSEWKGNTDEPCTLIVTKKGGEYTVTLDGEALLKWHDDEPLSAAHRFCIGGYLSRLAISNVYVTDLADKRE